ncbi:MAG TPA: ATP-binding protein [Solirubrobacter sp.]|nr:ATP-binding protein [Solirubrobacter sp.]
MRRRLTIRTVVASALLVAVVAATMTALAFAIRDQHDAAVAARRSQTVIAAANLAQQRLLSVQTSLRGYLIRGNDELLQSYRDARGALPDAALDLQDLVAGDPRLERRAAEIRDEALSYVNDYGDPVVARTREGGVDAGRALATASGGRERARSLEDRITKLADAERTLSAQRAEAADDASRRSLLIAVLGLGACVLALAAATAFVARRIVLPVGRLAAASERVRRGELDVTVPERRGDEVGRAGAAFNAMARALAESRDELESQNTELEMQAIELEERSQELTEAGDEARAQRDELSRTAAQLADEKRRAELYGDFAARLAGTHDPGALASIALATLAETAGADVGVLFAESWRDDSRWARAAVLGLEPSRLAEAVTTGGEGAAARAVAQREVVDVVSGALRVHTLAGEAPLRWELHVPLSSGSRTVGVATLGGLSSEGVDLSEAPVLQRLAEQAAVALAEAAALAQRDWLFQINAAVLDGVREGIALVGLDNELVFANAAMERLAAGLAMPVGAAIGAGGVSVAPDDYFEGWEAMLADGDEPTADELSLAGVVLERYTAPVDDAAGARIGRLVVLRDVTRERQAEQLKTDLMSTVSHELRTPLASVLGFTELLRTRRLDEGARSEILETVHREAQRLSALIDDFLDLQKLEQDRMELTRSEFSMVALLEESVATFAGQSSSHVLELAPSAGSVVAFGDRARIAQVAANLLSNAIKYSPAGGVVRIEASSSSAGVVRVSVADKGVGIPAAEHEHVFEKFFRVARPDLRVGGTGLGLALAHEIVVAHGGEMGFESVEGSGSTF